MTCTTKYFTNIIRSLVFSLIMLTALFSITSCGGGAGETGNAGGGGGGSSLPVDNTQLTAKTGNNQVVSLGSIVNLDGTQSSDLDGDDLSYVWGLESFPSGSVAAISDVTSSQPNFTADIAGEYSISLVVSDGNASSEKVTMTVRAVEGTVLSFETLSSSGGLIGATSADDDLHGASLQLSPDAVADDTLLGISTLADLPTGSPLGRQSIGPLFSLTPSGINFAEPVTLTLPIPTAEDGDTLYIAVWDETNSEWQKLDSTVSGDFISATIEHFSPYGLFREGASMIKFVNSREGSDVDKTITINSVAGPVISTDTSVTESYPPNSSLPAGGVDIKQNESLILELLPGRYHFVVSYPKPGVANSLWFTVPELSAGSDDNQVDQVVTLTDAGGNSDDVLTDLSIDFPGSSVVSPTNFRPIADCNADVPAGISIAPLSAAELGLPQIPTANPSETGTLQVFRVGPIKLEEFYSPHTGINYYGDVSDPEGSSLRYFWNYKGAASLGRNSGTTNSGDRLNETWGPAATRPTRGGLYTVSLTVYDDLNLFNECRWLVDIIPNAKPYHDVVVDDRVIDFGRQDGGPNASERKVIGIGPALQTLFPSNLNPFVAPVHPLPQITEPYELANLCAYQSNPLSADNLNNPFFDAADQPVTTFMRTLPTLPTPGHINPSQYPKGMTCIYAVDADADLDLSQLSLDNLDAHFLMPSILHGRGTTYTSVPIPDASQAIANLIIMSDGQAVSTFNDGAGYPAGGAIYNDEILDAYRATVSYYANQGWLPNQPHERDNASVLPEGASQANINRVDALFPFVAPAENPLVADRTPEEFPYVIGFIQGSDSNGRGIKVDDIVTSNPNPLSLTPQGQVIKVMLEAGSWQAGDAKGYLVLMHVRNDFWDLRQSSASAVPELFIQNNSASFGLVSYIGQSLPVIWEAPDDPDASLTTHDRRHLEPDTIPRGGTDHVEARVTDTFSQERRGFGAIAYPTQLLPVAGRAAFIALSLEDKSTTIRVQNLESSDTTDVLVDTESSPSLIGMSATGTVLIEKDDKILPYPDWGKGSPIDLVSACGLVTGISYNDDEAAIADDGSIYFNGLKVVEVIDDNPFNSPTKTLSFVFAYNSLGCQQVPIDFNGDGVFDTDDRISPFSLGVSAQGNELIFIGRDADFIDGLWAVKTDGSDLRRLRNVDVDVFAISDDGSHALIDIEEDEYGYNQMGIISTVGGTPLNLTAVTDLFVSPASSSFSSDGSQIVSIAIERKFRTSLSDPEPRYGLVIIEADGSDWRWLDTDSILVAGQGDIPRFMPDGKGVIFSGSTDPDIRTGSDLSQIDDMDLYVIPLDGGELRNVTATTDFYEGRSFVQ